MLPQMRKVQVAALIEGRSHKINESHWVTSRKPAKVVSKVG